MFAKVKVDSKVSIAYKIIGDIFSSDYLCVFLHEGMGSILQFHSFPEKFCDALNLPGLVYDRYGYGYSTPLQEKRKVDYLEVEANYFLPQFLEKLGLFDRKLILIGHSDGASIALIFGAIFPLKCKLIVSMAAHVFVEEISRQGAISLEKKFYSDAMFRLKLENYHFEHTESTLLAFTRTIPSEDFSSFNIEHHLRNIAAPILVIQGSDDHYGTIKQVESIIANTNNLANRSVIINGCGHNPHLSNTEEVIQLSREFIRTQLKF